MDELDIEYPAGIELYEQLPNKLANDLLIDEICTDSLELTQRLFDLALQFEKPGVLTRLANAFLPNSEAREVLERAEKMVAIAHEIMWRIGESEIAEAYYRENNWVEISE